MKTRQFHTKVAETLEELLQAAAGGQTSGHLPPRSKKPDLKSLAINQQKRLKMAKESEDEKKRLKKDLLRKKRDESIKRAIKESNHGGRGMSTKEFNKKLKEDELKKK